MNSLEKDEISKLPEKYRPLGAWSYFGLSLLFSVPVVGFIFLIIFSISKSNINRRSFARSYFCIYIISGIISAIAVIIAVAVGVNFSSIMQTMSSYIQ